MNFFRKSSRRWRGVDFMSLVPVQACGWVSAPESGLVVVLQPRFRTGLLGRYLQPRLKTSKQFLRIPLEERGSYLWCRIDGKASVGDLAVAFGRDFPDEDRQVAERVATYLYQMAENHMIEFSNLNI